MDERKMLNECHWLLVWLTVVQIPFSLTGLFLIVMIIAGSY